MGERVAARMPEKFEVDTRKDEIERCSAPQLKDVRGVEACDGSYSYSTLELFGFFQG